MKQFFYTALFLTAGGMLNSCNKLDEALRIDVGLTMQEVNFTVPIIPAAGTYPLGESNVSVNVDSIINAANSKLGIGNIRDAHITSCTIDVIDPTGTDNLGVLSSCKAELSSNTKTDFVTVAEVTDNPDNNQNSITLTPNTSVSLKDYFGATSFSYKLSGTARRATSAPMKLRATIRYTLDVGL